MCAFVVCAPAVLAGCGGSAPAVHRASATLTVHVGVFGGPALPNGKMAVSGAPQRNVAIVATSSTGQKRTGHTDAGGTAVLDLPPGRYEVRGPCPPAKRIALTAGHHTLVQLPCEVP